MARCATREHSAGQRTHDFMFWICVNNTSPVQPNVPRKVWSIHAKLQLEMRSKPLKRTVLSSVHRVAASWAQAQAPVLQQHLLEIAWRCWQHAVIVCVRASIKGQHPRQNSKPLQSAKPAGASQAEVGQPTGRVALKDAVVLGGKATLILTRPAAQPTRAVSCKSCQAHATFKGQHARQRNGKPMQARRPPG